ncbi:MAG: SCP2 sterol-binding domain-containing protein [Pseudomonadales bacterium]|nr:SCP2 sterol-binding domain-containing protein [Pseudomonadales bacterium]
MGLKFMTDEWFAKIAELTEAAGDLDPPAGLQDLILNITVTGDDGDRDMCMNAGNIEQGHKDGAPTTLTLPADLARRLFIENDQSAGMQGFMSGQIKVEGDMSKLMAMQTVQASEKQQALQEQIVEITE